ncbi:MAG: glycine cleavage system aminomethyltransferase GcvT, partial [Nitrospirota bacterium]|nr:glycine cleavage system aminomethyltransferase GcvT [Nitrospirota bacterium]
MKQTPLYEAHVAAGAKLVDFAGWEMPIQYSGVLDEYQAVRQQAGLFDVSHMGRIEVEGHAALPFLQRVTTNDVRKIEIGAAQYSMVCNPEGGIKDDIFIYRLAAEKFFLCVNASNLEKIWKWFNEQNQSSPDGCRLTDRSTETAQLALQGQVSKEIIRAIAGSQVDDLRLRWCQEISLPMGNCLIARTGYTGEFGYELYVPKGQAREVWDALLKAGTPHGLKPVGLGARDLLR